MEAIHRIGCETLKTEFNISLLLGLKALGRHDKALAIADQAIQRVEANGEALYLPEILRGKGGIHLAIQQRPTRSLALSCQQGARAWELRGG